MKNQIVADGPGRLLAGQAAKRQKESGKIVGRDLHQPGLWKSLWLRYRIALGGRHQTGPEEHRPSPKSLW